MSGEAIAVTLQVNLPLSGSLFPEQFDKSFESPVVRVLVGAIRAESLADTHESMIRALVCDGIIKLGRRVHCVGCRRNGSSDTIIRSSVEAVYGSVNGRDDCRA